MANTARFLRVGGNPTKESPAWGGKDLAEIRENLS